MSQITIIAFHPTGYELRIEVTFEELTPTLRRLSSRGYTPSREPVLTAEGLPICPRHGVPMQQRNRHGDLWYSHKMVHPTTGETVYCRGYASASSPGYDILLPVAEADNSQRSSEVETTGARSPKAGTDTPALVLPGMPPSGVPNCRFPQVNPGQIAQRDAALHTALFGGQSG